MTPLGPIGTCCYLFPRVIYQPIPANGNLLSLRFHNIIAIIIIINITLLGTAHILRKVLSIK